MGVSGKLGKIQQRAEPCWSNDGLQILYQNLLGLKLVPANGLGGTNVPGTNFIGDFDLR